MSFLLNTFRRASNVVTFIPRRIFNYFRPGPSEEELLRQELAQERERNRVLQQRLDAQRQPRQQRQQRQQDEQEEQKDDGRMYSKYNPQIRDFIQGDRATKDEAYALVNKIHREFKKVKDFVYFTVFYSNGGSDTFRLFGDTITNSGSERTGVAIFRKAITQGEEKDQEEENQEDAFYEALDEEDFVIDLIVFVPEDRRQRRHQRGGGLYTGFNTTKIDLRRYDIYTREQVKYDRSFRHENCLLVALRHADIDEETINDLKLNFFKNLYYGRQDLKILSERIERCFTVHSFHRSKEKLVASRIIYGDPELPNIDLALYNNHFFIFERTKYTKFSIKNYKELNHIEDWYNITGIRSNRATGYFRDKRAARINSLWLIRLLDEQGLINEEDPFLNLDQPKSLIRGENMNIKRASREDIGRALFKPYTGMKRLRRLGSDDPEAEVQALFGGRLSGSELENKMAMLDKEDPPIFFADCEAFVNGPPGTPHRLLAVAILNDQTNEITIKRTKGTTARNVALSILSSLPDKSIVYFHNLEYDFSLLGSDLAIRDVCFTNNKVYNVKIFHDNKMIEFRDSYKIITMGLAKFGKTFGVQSKLDCIAYNYYSEENEDKLIDPEEYRQALRLSGNNGEDLAKRFDPSEHMKDGLFDPYKYYMSYLRQDVITLQQGMREFEKHVRNLDPALSVHDYLTIGALALAASYEDLRKFTPVNNTLRAFSACCFTGGDVQVNPKFLKQRIPGPILDVDACSLYPSAMIRAGREGWFNTGPPQYRTDDWEKYSTLLRIRITKVRNKIQPPILCYLDRENGNKHDYNVEGRIYNVHSILLKAYIELLDIDYEIIDGIQFRGPPVRFETIEKIFNMRIAAKKEKNEGFSQTLKLLMNATYGKTIERQRFEGNVFVKNDDMDRFMLNNFTKFNRSRKFGRNLHCVSTKQLDKSFGIPYVGAIILAMAKVIMFEVREAIHNTGGEMLYTDTDSIHIRKDDLERANAYYQKKYGRTLDDKSGLPGTFHNDLPNGAEFSEAAYFFGKKAYAHLINGKWHVTMKGITQKGIDHIAKQGDIEELLLKPLAEGKPVEVLMNPPGFGPSFQLDFDNVHFKEPFHRTVQF